MNRALPSRRVALGAALGGVAVALAAVFAITSGGGDAGAERAAGAPATSAPAPVPARPGPARWSVASTGGEPMGVTADADGVIAVSYQSVQSTRATGPSGGTRRSAAHPTSHPCAPRRTTTSLRSRPARA